MQQVETASVGVVKALGDDVSDPEMRALKDKLILGSNPNAVASARAALEGGRGQRIEPSQAQAGDIVILPPPWSHIGVATGNNTVVHNSSSRAAFVNNTQTPAGATVYRVTN